MAYLRRFEGDDISGELGQRLEARRNWRRRREVGKGKKDEDERLVVERGRCAGLVHFCQSEEESAWVI